MFTERRVAACSWLGLDEWIFVRCTKVSIQCFHGGYNIFATAAPVFIYYVNPGISLRGGRGTRVGRVSARPGCDECCRDLIWSRAEDVWAALSEVYQCLQRLLLLCCCSARWYFVSSSSRAQQGDSHDAAVLRDPPPLHHPFVSGEQTDGRSLGECMPHHPEQCFLPSGISI